jgi:hypothetical protein
MNKSHGNNEYKQITWTPQLLGQFKRAYQTALDNGIEVFTFQDNQYVPSYARYLIQYLESQFKEKGK